MVRSAPVVERTLERIICLPFSTPNPRRRMQFGQGAILEYFANPTPLFEHSLSTVANALSCTPLKVGLASEGRSTTGLGRRRKHEDDFDAPGEGGFVVWIYLGLKMT
jgi:hypothetical protein